MVVTMVLMPLAVADSYPISVTRKSANLYKVDGRDTFILTKHCHEYAHGDAAILDAYGTTGDLKFPEADSDCPVKAVLGKSEPPSGEYKIQISQEGDDWYEIYGQGLYIHTIGCFNMAMSEDAILQLSAGGYGSLTIEDDQCTVDGVYSKLRL
ncbi:hypothetical protein IV02_08220 [Pseudomonas syringae]|uniref:Uncharacterized protein n=2 Tax=Pseudomonas syringae TaxID=317 RepID=A0A085VAE7_PSESX|nr:hypothetical protein IV02_08220 [Pseudomonas syringae]